MISAARRRAYGGPLTVDILHPDAVMLKIQSWQEQVAFRYLSNNISKLIIDDVVYDDPDVLSTMYSGAYNGWIKHPSFVSGEHTIYVFPKVLYNVNFTDVSGSGCNVMMARAGRLQPKISGYYFRGITHFLSPSTISVSSHYIKTYLQKVYIPKGERDAFLANSSLAAIPNIDKKLIEVNFNIIEDE